MIPLVIISPDDGDLAPIRQYLHGMTADIARCGMINPDGLIDALDVSMDVARTEDIIRQRESEALVKCLFSFQVGGLRDNNDTIGLLAG